MTNDAPSEHAFRVADLAAREYTFDLRPGAESLREMAGELGIDAVRKLSFTGTLAPLGKKDWSLTGRLGATVVQECSVTLAPVKTRIEAEVTRRYLRDFDMPDAPEAEMPEDDTTEALEVWIDPASVMFEALSLELPPYPRAADSTFDGARFAEKGVEPLTDEALRPFAALADLKQKMQGED